MEIFASRQQPLFPAASMTSATPTAGASAGFSKTGSVGGLARSILFESQPASQRQQQGGAADEAVTTGHVSSRTSQSAVGAAEPGSVDSKMEETLQQQPWVPVGGSWKDEDNVCGYWRFSEGAAVVGELEDGKQVRGGLWRSGLGRYMSRPL